MRKHLVMCLGAALAAAVVVEPTNAGAAISGVVSIPSNVCSGQTAVSRAWCPYFSIQSGYAGFNVATIYVDAYLYTSSAIQAKACEESYSGGGFYCGAYSNRTGSNTYVDMSVAGFSAISGAPKVQWDYYLVYMDNYTGGTFDVLGVGYL